MATKYEALEIYLRDTVGKKPQITMSFKEIEAIIAAPLPQSAFTHRAWWSNQNDFTNRPQAKAWLAAGCEVDSVSQSRASGSVSFRKK